MSEVQNIQRCHALERQIAEAYSTAASENAKPVRELIEDFRTASRLTVAEFSAALGINAATYNRWTNGKPPLPPKLTHKLRTFLAKCEADSAPHANQSIILDGARINLLGMSDILDRHHHAASVWVFKHLMPFKAGIEGLIRQMMIDAMTENDIQFHFVFFGDNQSCSAVKHPAQHSFIQFKEALYRSQGSEKKSANLHGYLITSESDAFRMGIAASFTGLVLDIYDTERRKESSILSQRDFDLFTEVSATTYDAHEPHKMVGDEKRLWVEMPPKRKLPFYRTLTELMPLIKSCEILNEEPPAFPPPPKDIDLIY